MATWQVIEYAGLTLKKILERHVAATLPVSDLEIEIITTKQFADLDATAKPTITLFLYRVIENAELRNSRQVKLPDGRIRRQPMVLELCYLVTPWGVRLEGEEAETAALEEQQFLGLILQAFHDNAEVGRSELFEKPGKRVWGESDCLQIAMESLPLEDHYRIWDSSEMPYRTSLTYRVRVASLESTRIIGAPPVVEATLSAGKM